MLKLFNSLKFIVFYQLNKPFLVIVIFEFVAIVDGVAIRLVVGMVVEAGFVGGVDGFPNNDAE